MRERERADGIERILRWKSWCVVVAAAEMENIISFSSNRSSFSIEIELGYKLPIAK